MGNTYIGRFAPTPSGPLHLGSLMSATCSYLQAKSQHGRWLVRIEDVDTPRIVKGASDIQLKQLENFGLEWDDTVLYQSKRINDYNDLIQQLHKYHKIYACECSRKQLKATAKASEIGFIYPRNCINKHLTFSGHSLRFKTNHQTIIFKDKVYGMRSYNIQDLSSDWVIQRADGVIAYHLAVVADDAFQGITEVVRGLDILPLTPLHIELQKELKLQQPKYLHHPLIEQNYKKLSKQNHAQKLSPINKINTLNTVLNALGQTSIATDDLNDFWQQSIKQWDSNLIPPHNFKL